jgi:hypothetical protein
MAAREAQKEHAGGSADLWRKLSYLHVEDGRAKIDADM